MKKSMIPAVVTLVLALVIVIGEATFLSPCVHDDGTFGSCHWAGRALLGTGCVLAAQALLSVSRVRALARGRYNVAYDDIRFAAPACLRHRIALNFEAVASGKDTEGLLADILAEVPER